MAAIKKYDYAQICSERGVKYLYEKNPYLFVEDEFGFTHKISRCGFSNGSEVGFRSLIGDKTEYFKKLFYKKFKGKVDERLSFEGFEYSKSLQYTNVTCTVHGAYRTKPNWLLNRGHHCDQCAEETRSERKKHSVDEFITLAKNKHVDKYEYDFVVYDGCRKPVLITCKVHGGFYQVPYYHLAGNGCPECGYLQGGYGAKDYARACPSGSSIYLMKLCNDSEMFYKIGISKDSRKRGRIISSKTGYEVEVLAEMRFENAEEAFYGEKYLHDIFKFCSFSPQILFQGHTECFSFISVTEFEELKRIAELRS